MYEIDCIQCDKRYIRQTWRFLQTWLLEHARSIKNKNNKTVLAEHVITPKQNF